MLQNLRDNLKGVVAVVVITIFAVPMILFGIDQLRVGSGQSGFLGTVNGEKIDPQDFSRALNREKNTRMNRGNLDANSPELDDSVLTPVVLKRLAEDQALLTAAKEGGMGASSDELWQQIFQIPDFQVDGVFDAEQFRRVIYGAQFTQSTFLAELSKDFMLQHLHSGVGLSSFVTDIELELIAAITEQKRSFFAIKIPAEAAGEVSVSEEEIQANYQENTAQYKISETVVVKYLEYSLEQVAQEFDISDEEVRQAYDDEVKDFVAEPKFIVAHILLQSEDGRDEKVTQIQEKLAAGDTFESLVELYSEDLGSKASGGKLGELIDAFGKEFVSAAKLLEAGAVSPPVKTDRGVHFVKVLEKQNVEPPSYDERVDFLKNQLQLSKADGVFRERKEKLDEMTFGASGLDAAAEFLKVEVKVSEPFGRSGDQGFATQAVANAAFQDDVLVDGQNSPVVELEGERVVVLRLDTHNPESVKPLADVQEQIKSSLEQEKENEALAAIADELIAKLDAGEEAEVVAEESKYEYQLNEEASRTDFQLGGMIIQQVFSLPRPGDQGPVFEKVASHLGGYSVVGLTKVVDGSLSQVEESRLTGIRQQLQMQQNNLDLSSFRADLISRAKIELPSSAESGL